MGTLRQTLLENPPPPVPPPAMLAPELPAPRPPLGVAPSGAPAPASAATMAPAPGAPPTWTFPVQGYDGKVDLHWGSHAGAADLFATPGTPVVAAVGGTVLDAGYSSVGGNNVLIQGADGNQYYYAHLKDAPLVKAGQPVAAGAQLGGVGDTGNAKGTGAHLHFGAGPSILNGTGPAGGAGGGNFDAVGELRRALAGPVPPSATQAVDLHAYARGAAERAGIDPATFERQIQQESGFNPQAKSPAGATGIAQIVPQYHPGVNPTDPIASLDYAANLMAANVAKYGSYATALAAYNAGPGAVAQYGGVPPYEETQRYIRAILPGGKEPPVSAPVHPSSPDLLALTQAAAANTAAVPPYQAPPSPYPRYQPPAPKPLPPPPVPEPALGATAYGLQDNPVLGQSSYDQPYTGPSTLDQPAMLPPLSPPGARAVRPLPGGAVETTYPSMITAQPGTLAPTPYGFEQRAAELNPPATATIPAGQPGGFGSPTGDADLGIGLTQPPPASLPTQIGSRLGDFFGTLGRAGFGMAPVQTPEQRAAEQAAIAAQWNQPPPLTPGGILGQAPSVLLAPSIGQTQQDVYGDIARSTRQAVEAAPGVREWDVGKRGPLGLTPLDVAEGVVNLLLPTPDVFLAEAPRVAAALDRATVTRQGAVRAAAQQAYETSIRQTDDVQRATDEAIAAGRAADEAARAGRQWGPPRQTYERIPQLEVAQEELSRAPQVSGDALGTQRALGAPYSPAQLPGARPGIPGQDIPLGGAPRGWTPPVIESGGRPAYPQLEAGNPARVQLEQAARSLDEQATRAASLGDTNQELALRRQAAAARAIAGPPLPPEPAPVPQQLPLQGLGSGLPPQLGALGGPLRQAGVNALQGAVAGAAGVQTNAALTGEEPSPGDYLKGAAIGAVGGAALGRFGRPVVRRGVQLLGSGVPPRPEPPEGFAKAGELLMSPPEAKPNLSTWERYAADHPGLVRYDPSKGGYAVSGKLPKDADGIRQIWKEMEVQPRLPLHLLKNEKMNTFLQRVAENKAKVASGEMAPEGMVLSHLATVASIRRGASSLARALQGGLTEEQVLRSGVDLQAITGVAKGQTKGIVIRPEMLWSTIASDTTDPVMMKMLTGIARPDSFSSEAAREAAIAAGVEELYRRTTAAGHGHLDNALSILGKKTVRGGVEVGEGGRAWKDTEPALWDKVQGWARGEGDWANLTPEEDRQRFASMSLAESPRGIGPTKSNFWPAMFTNPDLATLDGRMRNDVFGMADNVNLSPKEYDYLVQKVHDAVGHDFRYGSQWLAWEYVGGEKTTYNALTQQYDKVSQFMHQAEDLAKQRGVPIGDVIDELSAQQPKLATELGDPTVVKTRIGVAAQAIQHLRPGANQGEVLKAIPELQSLIDQAGVKLSQVVSAGRGYWLDDAGKAVHEVDLDLLVEGPRSANEWLAAALGHSLVQANGQPQDAVLISHLAQGTDPVAHLVVQGKDLGLLHDLAAVLQDHLGGWHIGVKETKNRTEARIFIAGLDAEGQPIDHLQFQQTIETIEDMLKARGLQVTSPLVDLDTSTRFMPVGEYDATIRGGPEGHRVVGGVQGAAGAETGRSPLAAAGPLADQPGGGLPDSGGVRLGDQGGAQPGASPGASPGAVPGANQALGAAVGLGGSQTGTDEDTTPEERLKRGIAGLGAGIFAGRRARTAAGAAREGFAGNIRLSKYPEEVQQLLQQAADANPAAMESARRGVLPDSVVQDLSRYSGIDVDKIARTWQPGRTQNAETLLALREALAQQATRVIAAQRAYREGAVSASGNTVTQLAQEIARHRALQEVVSGTTAEAGRALRQFRQPVTGEGATEARLNQILKTLYKHGRPDDFLKFMKDVDLNDPVAVANAVRTVYSPSKTDLFSWYLYNSMLSSPVGRVRDVISTAANTLTSPIESAVAAPIDAAISAVRRSPRGVRLSEVPAEYRGMAAGLGDAWRDAVSVIQHGFTPGQARADLEVASREPVKGPLGGALLNAPTRITAANDVFFRAANARASIYAQAARQADNAGLKGAEWTQRVNELRANPTEAMVEEAMKTGRYRVWQNDGAVVDSLARLKEQVPALKAIIPFTQTPINLLKFAVERSPVGFFSTGVGLARGASQRDTSLGLARAGIGSALFYGAYQMAEQGLITGPVPQDPAERDAFYREGKQPYAVRVGDQWHSYQGLAQAPILGGAAAAVDAFQKGHSETAMALGTTAVLGLAKTMVDQPFMQGLANVLQAIDDPGRYGENYLEQAARMPVPQAIQFVARATDDLIRDPQGPGEALLASLPGVSRLVEPKRNVFGQRVERAPGQLGLRALDPSRPTMAQDSRLESELARLQRAEYKVEPGPANKNVTVGGQNIKLEREQYDKYRQVGGKLAYAVLSQAMNAPGWDEIPDAQKAKFIDDTIRKAREYAKEQLGTELAPAAYEQYVEQQRRRAAGE